MTHSILFRTILVAAALFAAPACNQDKTAKSADNAAEAVNDRTGDLRKETREMVATSNEGQAVVDHKAADLAKDTARDVKVLAVDTAERQDSLRNSARDSAGVVAAQAKDVSGTAADLAKAQTTFEVQRETRLATLRSVHSVIASQTRYLGAMATALPLTVPARASVNEKLAVFQMRIDETGNAIQALQTIDAPAWDARHLEVNQAMDRLEDARKDAWKSLSDAKRIDRTSMR